LFIILPDIFPAVETELLSCPTMCAPLCGCMLGCGLQLLRR
jgi:hypothetical protein